MAVKIKVQQIVVCRMAFGTGVPFSREPRRIGVGIDWSRAKLPVFARWNLIRNLMGPHNDILLPAYLHIIEHSRYLSSHLNKPIFEGLLRSTYKYQYSD